MNYTFFDGGFKSKLFNIIGVEVLEYGLPDSEPEGMYFGLTARVTMPEGLDKRLNELPCWQFVERRELPDHHPCGAGLTRFTFFAPYDCDAPPPPSQTKGGWLRKLLPAAA